MRDLAVSRQRIWLTTASSESWKRKGCFDSPVMRKFSARLSRTRPGARAILLRHFDLWAEECPVAPAHVERRQIEARHGHAQPLRIDYRLQIAMKLGSRRWLGNRRQTRKPDRCHKGNHAE